MSKCDIVLDRSMTISAGNYSTIRPTVSITLKDIDVNDITEKYQKLSNVLDVLMLLETTKLGDEILTVNDGGFKNYIKILSDVKEPLDMLKKSVNEL